MPVRNVSGWPGRSGLPTNPCPWCSPSSRKYGRSSGIRRIRLQRSSVVTGEQTRRVAFWTFANRCIFLFRPLPSRLSFLLTRTRTHPIPLPRTRSHPDDVGHRRRQAAAADRRLLLLSSVILLVRRLPLGPALLSGILDAAGLGIVASIPAGAATVSHRLRIFDSPSPLQPGGSWRGRLERSCSRRGSLRQEQRTGGTVSAVNWTADLVTGAERSAECGGQPPQLLLHTLPYVLTEGWRLGVIPLLGNQKLLSRNSARLVLRLAGAVSALWLLGHQLGLVRSRLGKEKSKIARA